MCPSRRSASSTAQCSAARDCSEPSIPTKTRNVPEALIVLSFQGPRAVKVCSCRSRAVKRSLTAASRLPLRTPDPRVGRGRGTGTLDGARGIDVPVLSSRAGCVAGHGAGRTSPIYNRGMASGSSVRSTRSPPAGTAECAVTATEARQDAGRSSDSGTINTSPARTTVGDRNRAGAPGGSL